MSKNKENEIQETDNRLLENLSFEESLSKLEKVVENLERGDITLDDAIKSYEYGFMLKNHCQTILNNYKMKVEKLVKQTNQATFREDFTEED